MPAEGLGRLMVVVSGAPGAGKTTIAAPLARALNLPLIAKDLIKESLYDSLVPPEDASLETSRRMGAAAMELLWLLAAAAPSAVLEANFRPRSEYERGKLASLGATIIEAYCRCDPAETIRRYKTRAEGPSRHRAHVLGQINDAYLSEFDGPIGLGPVVEVDTASPVDVTAIAQAIEAARLGRP